VAKGAHLPPTKELNRKADYLTALRNAFERRPYTPQNDLSDINLTLHGDLGDGRARENRPEEDSDEECLYS
jgi:hypothetical protein